MRHFELVVVRLAYCLITVMIALLGHVYFYMTAEGLEHSMDDPDLPDTTHSWYARGVEDREWDLDQGIFVVQLES